MKNFIFVSICYLSLLGVMLLGMTSCSSRRQNAMSSDSDETVIDSVSHNSNVEKDNYTYTNDGKAEMTETPKPSGFPEDLRRRIGVVTKRINDLKNLADLCAKTVEMDYVQEKANQSDNPQAVIDFLLLRWERNDSKIQLKMAEVANEAADMLSEYKNDSRVDQLVIDQGIAKYTDMSDFFIKRAKEQRASFTQHWNNYVLNYGSGDAYIFDQDDAELQQYGVE